MAMSNAHLQLRPSLLGFGTSPHPIPSPSVGQELWDQAGPWGARDGEEVQRVGGVPSLARTLPHCTLTLPQLMVRVSVLLEDREVCKSLQPAKGYAGCIAYLSPVLGLRNDKVLRSGSLTPGGDPAGMWGARGAPAQVRKAVPLLRDPSICYSLPARGSHLPSLAKQMEPRVSERGKLQYFSDINTYIRSWETPGGAGPGP